ncbi:MAG: hypothetical protein I3I98_02630 [Mobilibacterium timonense]|uniref:GH25 family lysozyme n=1 Tax=Mobilibacterium timonense TaxID=1871012 RepID=UPI0023542102|nr:GH25 family lysozyme [Mobilibacterium timonense]MBM6990288.1 hypothetical protein [Mobilibacterium timonense]
MKHKLIVVVFVLCFFFAGYGVISADDGNVSGEATIDHEAQVTAEIDADSGENVPINEGKTDAEDESYTSELEEEDVMPSSENTLSFVPSKTENSSVVAVQGNSWIDENGARYYTDENGQRVKGIYKIGDKIYYFDSVTGALCQEAGWRDWNNNKYFTDQRGIAYAGQFITFGEPRYYMGVDGALSIGVFTTTDGSVYYSDNTGQVINKAQWLQCDGKRYFSNSEGELYRDRFITFGENRYYMGSDGAVKTGVFTAKDGNMYNADEAGLVVRKAQWIQKEGRRYFSDSEGELYRDQFITFGENRYYMGSDGAVKTGVFTAKDGNMYNADETGLVVRKAQWIQKEGKRYFSNQEGELYRNRFITFGDLSYYMGSDGTAQTGIFEAADGRIYNADSTGQVIRKAQWIEQDGKKYFSNAEGVLYRNTVISFGNTYYYMGADGALVIGSFYYHGAKYTTDDKGVINELIGLDGATLKGIDVSYAQGAINWQQVASDGVQFAIIRAAYRGYGSGRIVADDWFSTNIRGAIAAGIKVGVYFFSQAVSEAEGREEAEFIVKQISGYDVALPVTIDTEYISGVSARANALSVPVRTSAVKGFCQRVVELGYTPMIYASTSWLNHSLDMSQLAGVKVWVAQYYDHVTYSGPYTCWQYTSSGRVNGINGNVDMNYWYNK